MSCDKSVGAPGEDRRNVMIMAAAAGRSKLVPRSLVFMRLLLSCCATIYGDVIPICAENFAHVFAGFPDGNIFLEIIEVADSRRFLPAQPTANCIRSAVITGD